MQGITRNGFIQKLFRPVDNSALVAFRALFGLLLFAHCCSFVLSGKLYENFIQPPFTFTYIGFEFLQPLPGNGMYLYFGMMALLALLIMAGAWYRLAMPGFTLLWTLVYLMQKSNYNNHYYLMLLLCWLMCFMPAHRYFSVDARRNKRVEAYSCPQWMSWIFITELAILYFYAAFNKLTEDWLSGKFIAIQFSRLSTHHILGPIYGNRLFQLTICYGGFLFDLVIVPLLLWKKSRRYALAVYCLFHLFNSYTFRIGIFPYLNIALAVFFLEPATIRRLVFKTKPVFATLPPASATATARHKLIAAALGIYLLFQLALPLRSLFYPGNVFWTEEGYRMSWKMMLRVKTGHIHFKVKDPVSGKTWRVDPADKFSPSHVMWIAIAPDIAWQYAQRLKKEFSSIGYPAAEVYAIDSVVLNRNPPQLLIDTTVDLAAVKWQPFQHSAWILPFRKGSE